MNKIKMMELPLPPLLFFIMKFKAVDINDIAPKLINNDDEEIFLIAALEAEETLKTLVELSKQVGFYGSG